MYDRRTFLSVFIIGQQIKKSNSALAELISTVVVADIDNGSNGDQSFQTAEVAKWIVRLRAAALCVCVWVCCDQITYIGYTAAQTKALTAFVQLVGMTFVINSLKYKSALFVMSPTFVTLSFRFGFASLFCYLFYFHCLRASIHPALSQPICTYC